MPKTYELLLTETVDGLGIVGDVVTVRSGYARNYLLPRNAATTPSPEKIQALASRRAEAQRILAQQRADREQMVEKLEGIEIALVRACNDLGHLYGSVTQQDVAKALNEQGFAVKPRDVRLTQTIKRVGPYEIHIRPEADLEAVVKLTVNPDRPLELEKEAAPADAASAPAAADAAAPDAGSAEASEEKKDKKEKKSSRPAADAEPKAEKKSKKKDA